MFRAFAGAATEGDDGHDEDSVDILLDVTNPGRWKAHCHIAEHYEGRMMFSFNAPASGD